LKVALDAMGGDRGPGSVVRGMFEALRARKDLQVILVGDEAQLAPLLRPAEHSGFRDRIDLRHAPETITMEDSLAALKAKRNASSVFIAMQAVKSGDAQSVVSIGNTMAAYAAARMELGVQPGINRPGIAVPMPSRKGVCIVIDMGANVNCAPEDLVDFAVMASCYSHLVFGIPEPQVGLLNVGGEHSKGDRSLKEAHQALAAAPIHFAGNAEGNDVFDGRFDVIVCDGFVGNVLLKAAEGAAAMFRDAVREGLGRNPFRMLGALLLRGTVRRIVRRFDYSRQGGAPLLGVNGICIIGHGKSNSTAVMNALRVAHEAALNRLNESIQAALKNLGRVPAAPGPGQPA
jgi:phosphate acyltransferase